MAETRLQPREKTLTEKVNNFIFLWHQFPIDYWWRKKYRVAFGSAQHREMNPIDMLIEYREDLMMNKALYDETSSREEEENEALGLNEDKSKRKEVKVTKEEIDEDYENLDLSQYDGKL